jgi:hypothetical protein
MTITRQNAIKFEGGLGSSYFDSLHPVPTDIARETRRQKCLALIDLEKSFWDKMKLRVRYFFEFIVFK